MSMDRTELLRLVNSSQNCKCCGLLLGPAICYRGVLKPKVLFIGEAPGTSEYVLRKPFIGPAGKALEAMIQQAGLPKQVGFTNVVWCFPQNEELLRQEYALQCFQFWGKLLDMCKGAKLVAVGKFAKKVLEEKGVGFATWLYHPSYVLCCEHIRKKQLWDLNVSKLKLIR